MSHPTQNRTRFYQEALDLKGPYRPVQLCRSGRRCHVRNFFMLKKHCAIALSATRRALAEPSPILAQSVMELGIFLRVAGTARLEKHNKCRGVQHFC